MLVENLRAQRKRHQIQTDRKQSTCNSAILLHVNRFEIPKEVFDVIFNGLETRTVLFQQRCMIVRDVVHVIALQSLKLLKIVKNLLLLVFVLVFKSVECLLRCVCNDALQALGQRHDFAQALFETRRFVLQCLYRL